ncbi:serine/threonine protein phosphatase PrpC [Pseudomonas sp. SJZ079]|uniref:PP2C family protein-serine/threonine phosphatase n=1 Tax=Pseudomonas sp. SJZ079 TaxID=2572887 RepID=UPI00119C8ED9|nr:PP2C family serine/threonine-protein phosphatase [Pseudomonas sp. SJZ079]TWC38623.1 serine/threonine protein phosphatase PrpC [Pseudomonas sp. SJZ079]
MNYLNTPLESRLTAWLSRRTAPTGVRRILSLAAAVASEIGNVRSENQDRVAIARGWDSHGEEFVVAAVVDGMGGMRNGAECAALSLGTFLVALNQYAQSASDHTDEWMRRAVHAANNAVYSKFRGEGGATLVAVLIHQGRPVHWLSVGDSRVYRLAGKDLVQVSVDDTIAGQLGKSADASADQSKLLQFIGMGGDDLEPHIDDFNGEQVDAVVLTTDGVHYLAPSPGWLGRIVVNSPDAGSCAKRLIELAKWCGGHDNATVAMISFTSDSELESFPGYPRLDVWDAFGELQMLFDVKIDVSARGLRQEVLKVQRVPSKIELDEAAQAAGADDSSKDRRVKRIVKAKSSVSQKNKALDEAPEKDAPQLFMEFPNKNK